MMSTEEKKLSDALSNLQDLIQVKREKASGQPSRSTNDSHIEKKESMLNREVQAFKPFIWTEEDHLDVVWSCTGNKGPRPDRIYKQK